MKQFKKIIFVGRTGNCREVMAAEILKTKPLWYQPEEITAKGMVVLFPEPLNQKVEAVMVSKGFLLGKFASEQLEESDFSEDTLVITFERSLQEKIISGYKQAQNVYVLTELTGDELEIFDPTGQELVTYGLCYEAMEKTISRLADVLNDGSIFEQNQTDAQPSESLPEGENTDE